MFATRERSGENQRTVDQLMFWSLARLASLGKRERDIKREKERKRERERERDKERKSVRHGLLGEPKCRTKLWILEPAALEQGLYECMV